MIRTWISRIGPPLLLVLLALLPLLGTLGEPESFVGDPLGELPVKVWVYETFARIGVLGGRMDVAAFPNLGPLNNPDPTGTLVTMFLRPLVGRVLAYNLLVVGQLAASMLAAWALARALVGDSVAALVAGVVFGLSPLVLAYAVTGGVTDILNLWPYPLAILGLLRALQAPRERGIVAWALVGGAFGGIGLATCPYNFVVFASMLFPAIVLLPMAFRGGLVPSVDYLTEDGAPPWRRRLITLGAMGAALGIVGGVDALYIHAIMADPDSQMSASAVSATRHAPPYAFLQPGHRDRYVAYLADYVAIGKDALIERTTAARFYRAFAPGLVAIGLALFGLYKSPDRSAIALWVGIAVFCAVASTGPFLPLTGHLAFTTPVNAAWLLTQHLLPGGNLILEPFRYALPASLGLAMAAAYGAVALCQRVGSAGMALGFALPLLVLVEVAWVSPTPWPIPTGSLVVPPIYTELDRHLPPGPILELPYFDHGTDRFFREHFLQQLVHGRAIPNEVVGFVPRYLAENQFTATLLWTEKKTGLVTVTVTAPERVDADRARLATDGFVGIVLHPHGYASKAVLAEVEALLAPLGPPIEVGARNIYRLAPMRGR
ncbi:MAG: hypothetical protein Q8P18_29795 [Pseudomonadota bacterium]|nr:hypothetical protein [Pseudomonadota bacterium]